MKKRMFASIVSGLFVLGLSPQSLAVTFFTDFAQWQTSVNGQQLTDSLNDVGMDVFPVPVFIERPQFKYKVSGAVTLDSPANGIDPIWDLDGSSVYQNNVRAGFPPDVVTYHFDDPISAFGYDVRAAGLNSFGARIDIVTNDGQSGFFNLPTGTGNEFRGMLFPVPITALELRAVGSPFATHGADNIRLVPTSVPESEAYHVAVLFLAFLLVIRRCHQLAWASHPSIPSGQL